MDDFLYFLDKYKWYLLMLIVAGIITSTMVYYAVRFAHSSQDGNIEFDLNTIPDLGQDAPTSPYSSRCVDSSYFVNNSNAIENTTPEESFDVTNADSYGYVTYTDKDVSDFNKALYSLADEYFTVYYKDNRVSPILPLALANVETPGRGDPKISYSALYPTRILPPELLYNADVTTVLSNEKIFTVLSSEMSTQFRGAVQMSSTYGTGDIYFNNKMSGTEQSKLLSVDVGSHGSWVTGASSSAGDRFYVPDVCLRLSAAFNAAIRDMMSYDYLPKTEMQLVAQLGMYHQSSGVWHHAHDFGKVGQWKSSALAYEYATTLCSAEMLNVLEEYANTHEDYYIDGKTAKQLYISVQPDPLSKYAYKELVCIYPIKLLYAYIKLCQLY